MQKKLLKLARLVLKFASLETDKGTLIYAENLEVGTEVFIDDTPAEDGEYRTEDKIIIVAEGKIAEIKEIEIEEKEELEEAIEEVLPSEPDEKDLKIKELEDALAAKDDLIKQLEAKIKELEDAALAPVAQPLEIKATSKENPVKTSGALKYFQD